jgi:hypothetical protein
MKYFGVLTMWSLFMVFGVAWFYVESISDPVFIFWYFGGCSSYMGIAAGLISTLCSDKAKA